MRRALRDLSFWLFGAAFYAEGPAAAALWTAGAALIVVGWSLDEVRT